MKNEEGPSGPSSPALNKKCREKKYDSIQTLISFEAPYGSTVAKAMADKRTPGRRSHLGVGGSGRAERVVYPACPS